MKGRGALTHLGSGSASVRGPQVDAFYYHIKRMVNNTDARVSVVVMSVTGTNHGEGSRAALP